MRGGHFYHYGLGAHSKVEEQEAAELKRAKALNEGKKPNGAITAETLRQAREDYNLGPIGNTD